MGIKFPHLKNLISRLERFTATVIWITVIVQLSLSLTAQPALAQTFFETPKTFIVSEACNATTSIRRRETDPVALEINRQYQALGVNRSISPTHTLIEVNGARKWVALECGGYAELPSPSDNSIPVTPVAETPRRVTSPITAGQQTLSVISFNVESDVEDTDPNKVAQDIQRIPAADLWGLSEVANETAANIFRDAASAGADFGSILGTTGSNDKLQIVYNKKRLKLICTEELDEVAGTRKPLVAQFQLQPAGPEFLFTVNHFNRRDEDVRNAQAEGLRKWAATQSIPVLAVGDYNLDYDPSKSEGNDAFDIVMKDDVFNWIQPPCVGTNSCPPTGTQCDPQYNSILDFALVAGAAKQWEASSEILFANEEDYCPKEKRGFSDHRPVSAHFRIR